MTINRLLLIIILTLIVAWLWRLGDNKRTITIPGVGRVQLAAEADAAYWRDYYDRLAGDAGDYLH